ncbi:hypothetical protein ACFLRM_06335 [Acidobacteriota bacterium]
MFSLIFCVFVLGFHLKTTAQFTQEELSERREWEEYLKTSEIIDKVQMKSREALTKPWKLTLEKEQVQRYALWKNPEGLMKGYKEGWKWEISAYRLDKYLELNMVPPTVEKRFLGNRGSCQLWMDSWMNLREKETKKIKVPARMTLRWNRATYLQRAFDNLIANEDRHMGNILITKDWRVILIDHSRSFRTTSRFSKKLIYSEKHRDGPKLMRQLPRVFVEKIKALSFEVIKGIVGEHLTESEINAVLARKELILKEIDRLITKFGEDKVLY